MAQVSSMSAPSAPDKYLNTKTSNLVLSFEIFMTGIAKALVPIPPRFLTGNLSQAELIARIEAAAKIQQQWEQIIGPLDELETGSDRKSAGKAGKNNSHYSGNNRVHDPA